MKDKKYLFLALVLLSGCQREEYIQQPYEIVDETYVHKYGMEVTPQEWQTRGEHGQRITTLKNGVTVTENYSFGQLDGPTTYTFPYSSTIQRIETHQQGELIQEELSNLDGKPYQKVEYLGNNSKKVTKWYDQGHPQSVEELDGDILVKGEYYTLQGAQESQVVDRNGERTNRDLTGKLLSRDTIVGGHLYERTTLWPNNTPKEVISYKNGVIHGHRRTFSEDGAPQADEIWVDGLQSGITTLYVNGEKYAEVPYRNGVKIGVEKRYKDGSKLFEEITWIDGKQDGPSRTYLK